MSTLSSLGHFVRGFADSEAKREKAGGQGWYPFVTISRQAGAGGHALAEALRELIRKESADPLLAGWQCLDQELCRKAAQDPTIKTGLDNLLDERYRSSLEDYFVQMIAGESPQIVQYRAVFRIIRSIASLGKAIIVGRGGNFLTRDFPRGIHVRLVAPLETRILTMADRLKVSEEEAKRQIAKIDADRAGLIRDYFKADIEDPLQYDAVWNTGATRLDFIAYALLEMIKHKAEIEIRTPSPV